MTALREMRVLVVDDNPDNVKLIEHIMRGAGYTSLLSTCDPRAVAAMCEAWRPDLVLLDLHMPGWSGLDVMEEIRHLIAEPDSLPVLVVTADATPDARYRALTMGARDFITKPIDGRELLLRARNLLTTRALQTALAAHNAALDREVRARTTELETARLESLTLLAAVGEYHDHSTHAHTQRVGELASKLATALRLPEALAADMRVTAPLHDIGKVAVSQEILCKPGPLSAEERNTMMRHAEIGADILSSAGSPLFHLAADLARSHHEHWDGGGYPYGLSGEEIPLAGRITAVVDVFDALTHDRPYKRAWDVSDALELIRREAGQQFDPQVAEAFATVHELGEPAAAVRES